MQGVGLNSGIPELAGSSTCGSEALNGVSVPFRALANGIRDKPHFRRTGIVSKHRSGEKKGKNQAEQTSNESDPQKCAATGVDGNGRALKENKGRK